MKSFFKKKRKREREREKGRVGHYSARNPAIESGTKYLCFCESEREQGVHHVHACSPQEMADHMYWPPRGVLELCNARVSEKMPQIR